MSHSFRAPSGQWYFRNSDWSGAIQAEAPAGEEEGHVISMEDIEAIYLERFRALTIQKLEEADYEDLKHLMILFQYPLPSSGRQG